MWCFMVNSASTRTPRSRTSGGFHIVLFVEIFCLIPCIRLSWLPVCLNNTVYIQRIRGTVRLGDIQIDIDRFWLHVKYTASSRIYSHRATVTISKLSLFLTAVMHNISTYRTTANFASSVCYVVLTDLKHGCRTRQPSLHWIPAKAGEETDTPCDA